MVVFKLLCYLNTYKNYYLLHRGLRNELIHERNREKEICSG